MMTFRVFAVVLIAFVTTARAAPEKAIDPATIKEKVTINVGKKLYVRFEQKGDMLSNPKVVEKADPKTPTLTLDFLKQGDMLILATKNPFPKNLKFRALTRLKGRKDSFETSIVPVVANLASFELWQEPIEELVLYEFQLVDEKP